MGQAAKQGRGAESLLQTPWASLIYLPEKVTVRLMAGFQLTRNLLDLTGAFKNFNKDVHDLSKKQLPAFLG